MNNCRLWIVLGLLLTSVISCDESSDSIDSDSKIEMMQQWSDVLLHVNTSVNNWQSPIEVSFKKPVLKGLAEKELQKLFTISPKLDVSVSRASDDTLIIVPKTRWNEGDYKLSLHSAKLKDFSDLPDYQSAFSVIQSFNLSHFDLSTRNKQVTYTAQMSTRYPVDKSQWQEIIKLPNASSDVKVDISDITDKRATVIISGMEQQKTMQELVLSWDASPINVDQKGSQTLIIDGFDNFKVKGVSVNQVDFTVEVTFSSEIDKNQNLEGLIRLLDEGNTESISTRIDYNRVKIYLNMFEVSGPRTLIIDKSVTSNDGFSLPKAYQQEIVFDSSNPRIKFVQGNGILPPTNHGSVLEIDAINVKSFSLTAYKVINQNLHQFIQNNGHSDSRIDDKHKVGRYLWRKSFTLQNVEENVQKRHFIDIQSVIDANPSVLLAFEINLTPDDVIYKCDQVVGYSLSELKNYEGENADSYYHDDPNYYEEEDPCSEYYYYYGQNANSKVHIHSSDLGLLAKSNVDGVMTVVSTNLISAEAQPYVSIKGYNYQQQLVFEGVTDENGFYEVEPQGVPFYIIGDYNGRQTYLKTANNEALLTNHFKTSGIKRSSSINGFIYGERGVWRPGDDIYLSFILQDKAKTLPSDHPVVLEFYNPSNVKVSTTSYAERKGNLYTFKLKTGEDAQTGNWRAKVKVGDNAFSKTIKVEAFLPNRLKIELTPEVVRYRESEIDVKVDLFSEFLNGVSAEGLEADVVLNISPKKTVFEGYGYYIFDDQMRKFEGSSIELLKKKIDANGMLSDTNKVSFYSQPAGNLSGTFVSRVFEKGGRFSTNVQSVDIKPYDYWAGMIEIKGSGYDGAIGYDEDYTLQLISLDRFGNPASRDLTVDIYEIHYRWWWDHQDEDFAHFKADENHQPTLSKRVKTQAGSVASLKIKGEDFGWGRHLVRVCDTQSFHCSSQIVYMGWGQNNNKQNSSTDLLLASDKEHYEVGEVARISLQDVKSGSALFSLENGTRVLQKRWLSADELLNGFDVPIDSSMAPNVYVNVTLLQPHHNTMNDAPMRLYGYIPLVVDDSRANLKPSIQTPDTVRPKETFTVTVVESEGRAMDYTLAVVDEGLLGVTNFKTPDPKPYFFKREALGVKTWDYFDNIIGAYGIDIERLLRIGGGAGGEDNIAQNKKRRFPPVVKFLGVHSLAAGESAEHEVKLPNYIGNVRVMAVAVSDKASDAYAFGKAESNIQVSQPLSLLATVPRVVRPQEQFHLPVNIMVQDENINAVNLSVTSNKLFEHGTEPTMIDFSEGANKNKDRIVSKYVQVANSIGQGRLDFSLSSRSESYQDGVDIQVLPHNLPTIRNKTKVVNGNTSWLLPDISHGISGTNKAKVSISTLPQLNLEKRLGYLIQYPHGCLEQTTSSVFPQMYLDELVEMNAVEKQKIKDNIRAGISRLKRFQNSEGQFTYWPGGDYSNDWSSIYAAHFLVMAKRKGYFVDDILTKWLNFQSGQIFKINDIGYQYATLAYSLYVRALAGFPDTSAMNRLNAQLLDQIQESSYSQNSRLLLSAAYREIGIDDVADRLINNKDLEFNNIGYDYNTYGSGLRNRAVHLLATQDNQQSIEHIQYIANKLSGSNWYSTHSTAWALFATAEKIKQMDMGSPAVVTLDVDGKQTTIDVNSKIVVKDIKESAQSVTLKNTSDSAVYVAYSNTGTPDIGDEISDNKNLEMSVSFVDMKDQLIDVGNLEQGTDFKAKVSVWLLKGAGHDYLENIALTMAIPSGWELKNKRLEGSALPVGLDYQDIRDDKVMSYFSLSTNYWRAKEKVELEFQFNAAYSGKYYLPLWHAKPMYVNDAFAQRSGRWVKVIAK